MPDRPDLTSLLVDPALAVDLPAEAIPALLAVLASEQARLAALEAALAAKLLTTASGHTGEDRLLTVDEAAERLGVTRDWLRRRTNLPFVVKLSEGVVRYSILGLEQWTRTQMGR